MAANGTRAVNVNRLERFLSKLDARFAAKTNASTTDAGLMSASDKTKLDGIDLSGGSEGQVLTKGASGYGWAAPSGGAQSGWMLGYDDTGLTRYISVFDEGEA